jgi:hypothetical protein
MTEEKIDVPPNMGNAFHQKWVYKSPICKEAHDSILTVQQQPTTTMRILSFGGFDGCTQGGADAAKWLKSTFKKLRITRIITCFDHKMVSVSIFNNN